MSHFTLIGKKNVDEQETRRRQAQPLRAQMTESLLGPICSLIPSPRPLSMA